MTRPCNVPPMFQQPFRPPFFFLQGIECTPIIVIISFPYLQNTTVFYQNKFNKNLKSLKARHRPQIISGQDSREPTAMFSDTPEGSEGGCGNTLPPFPERPPLFPLPLPLVPACPPAFRILGQGPPQRSRGAGRLSSSARQRPPE